MDNQNNVFYRVTLNKDEMYTITKKLSHQTKCQWTGAEISEMQIKSF